ncbi:MAG: hypothetical protein DRG71_04450 [Deltaproteobacteria bacterium]|nr:hypothetical protein [Deltaproteobacteria bacterium]RLB20139.1 MAG: hypothetical protein DRG73_10695 [Deltaproteobacteria bacterium]RLB25109.1 MAG: hypothetical protein DRG71_04450 [Deltaproteobacteria bacterium]HDH87027.1 hypothetical protein [Desulfobacteraceae bacterium]
MDKVSQELMEYLKETMNHPDVSGFELIEILDIRSQLAAREPVLSDDDKTGLETLDRQLLKLSDLLVMRISEVADLAQMRKKAHALPSHWWWYLDEITMRKTEAIG